MRTGLGAGSLPCCHRLRCFSALVSCLLRSYFYFFMETAEWALIRCGGGGLIYKWLGSAILGLWGCNALIGRD